MFSHYQFVDRLEIFFKDTIVLPITSLFTLNSHDETDSLLQG